MDDFGQGSCRIDDGQRMKDQLTHVWNVKVPRTNEVDCDFFERRSSVLSWRKVSISRTKILVTLASIAGQNDLSDLLLKIRDPEMGTKDRAKARDAAMSQDVMMNLEPNTEGKPRKSDVDCPPSP